MRMLTTKIEACVALSMLLIFWSVLPAFTFRVNAVGGVSAAEHYIDVPFYYQVKTYYCGPAALQMVFDFYGENVSQFEIADVARTVPYVTYTDEMRRAAHFSNLSTSMGSELPENITGYSLRSLGYAAFEASGVSLDDLKSLINQGYPVILLMRWVPGEQYGHYRVAVGYNETHVFLHDPWNNVEWGGEYGGQSLAMNYTFFADMWSYSGNWSLLVSPWKVTISMPRETYVGQRFNVTANITYPCPTPFSIYDYPASSCFATIHLPEGLTPADGESAVNNLGELQAGSASTTSWTVECVRSGNYSISVEAEGKIEGFVAEKSDAGPSYRYIDRIGGYAASAINVTQPPQFFVGGIDKVQASPGASVNIYGGGATPNGTVVAFLDGSLRNETLGWTTAGSEGYWIITFTVPQVPPGNYTIYVLDNETLKSAPIGFSVLATSKIYIRGLYPTQATPGAKAEVWGGGATPNGRVEALLTGPINQTIVIIGSTQNPPIVINESLIVNMTVGWTNASEDGSWYIPFTVPNVTPGNYTIYVVDHETSTSDAVNFTVLSTQAMIKIRYVSATMGLPNTRVSISGDGATLSGEVKVYFDSLNVANTTADEWGSWSTSFQVPNVDPGNYTVKVMDTASNTTDSVTFTVTPPPTIHVYPPEGPVGSKITINGEGFPPRTGIYLTFEDLLFFTPVIIDENGKFNATIFVPTVNSGNYTIKAIGTYYYAEAPPVLANATFRVTMGLDTLFEALNETRNATQATYNEASSANETANATKEAAESAEAIASEARTYALTAMIFAIITAALSATALIKKKK